MTKIVIAPDKFKGSLSSLKFCTIIQNVLQEKLPYAQTLKLPLADGGDGTTEVLDYYLDAQKIQVKVCDPLFRKIKAHYLYSEAKQTAYIEMAAASGLHLLQENERNPMQTSTFGTGELIKHALQLGAKHIILGIGGSATNDAGLGMARALGYQLWDKSGGELQGKGEDLQKLHLISSTQAHSKIATTKFTVACDVTNPLFGQQGAAAIYAEQKGADSKMIAALDKGVRNAHNIMLHHFHRNVAKIQGAGAAGGLGAAAIVFLDAQLQSGIEIIKQQSAFQKNIQNADWIISGEGCLDAQTFQGKVIQGVIAELTTQKLALFCGKTTLTTTALRQLPIAHLDFVANYATSQTDAMQNAAHYLTKITENFACQLQPTAV